MTEKPLTEHEKQVMEMLLGLGEVVKGFPETDRGLQNVTRAWAKFISLEPYHVKFDPQWERMESPDYVALVRAECAWKEGIIPGEWLIGKIRDTCRFFPAPIEARLMYCRIGGFPPADGQEPVEMEFSPARMSSEE